MEAMVKTADIVNSNLWQLFPAINVDKVKDIPSDYPGLMGVPITFMDKYNPEQFEVCGITDHHTQLEDGKTPYRRILIRNLQPDLPEKINLVDWLARCGIDVTFDII